MAERARGQAAVEVLAYASFFLLVFVAMVSIFLSAQAQELSRAENAYAQQIAYGIADSVHTSFVAGPGFTQKVPIPPDLLGKPYNISISSPVVSQESYIGENAYVFVNWQGQGSPESFSAPLVANNFGAIPSGSFITEQNATKDNPVSFVTIDSSQGSGITMQNTYDSGGQQVILISAG